MDLFGQITWTVTINRGREGFGFTVFGCSPVQVGRVEEGSSAWMSEIRQDDCIVKINGLNVSRSTAESVAKLVRNSKTQITLEVFRPSIFTQQQLNYNSDSGVVADSVLTSPSSASSSTYHHDNAMFGDDDRSSSLSSTSSILYSASMVGEGHYQYMDSYDNRNDTNANKQFGYNSEQHQRKPLSTVTNRVTTSNKTNCPTNQDNSNSNYDTINSRTNGCLPRMGIKSKKSTSTNKPNNIGVTDNTNSIINKTSHTQTNHSSYKHTSVQAVDASSNDIDKSKLLQIESKLEDMITCLEDFVRGGHLGVKRFMRPLRAAELSREHFTTLFQNIEKIIDLSEELLEHVKQSSIRGSEDSYDSDQSESFFSSHVFLESLISFLDVKMEIFCDNYESYCNGLRQALVTLVTLKKDAKFGPIIINFNNNINFDLNKNSPDGFTLSSFLQQPLKHIKDLIVHLQEMTHKILQTGHKSDRLKKIVHILLSSCNKINENHRSLSNLSLNTITSSVLSLAHHGLRSNPPNVQERSPLMNSFAPPFISSPNNNINMASSPLSSSVVSCIDKELLEIQTKLLFPLNIRAFHLATASRHLIYSGNLELVDYEEDCYQVYVILTSDLLLLTRCSYSTQTLNVIEEPIMLVNIVGCEFHHTSPLELLISVETRLTSLQSPWVPKTFCLRAPSQELKVTWKNILEQRILSCKNERDVTLNNRSVENFV